MLFIFSTPELIIDMWQLKTAVFLHWCLICAVPFNNSHRINWTYCKRGFLENLVHRHWRRKPLDRLSFLLLKWCWAMMGRPMKRFQTKTSLIQHDPGNKKQRLLFQQVTVTLSAIDLLVLTSSDQLFLYWKKYFFSLWQNELT
jgi:hypothetical protein